MRLSFFVLCFAACGLAAGSAAAQDDTEADPDLPVAAEDSAAEDEPPPEASASDDPDATDDEVPVRVETEAEAETEEEGTAEVTAEEADEPDGDADEADAEPEPEQPTIARRELPDYDGRDEPGASAGEVMLWFPRILFFPVHLIFEYLIRQPLGWLLTTAERENWTALLIDFFTFEERRAGLVPTAFFDFGFQL